MMFCVQIVVACTYHSRYIIFACHRLTGPLTIQRVHHSIAIGVADGIRVVVVVEHSVAIHVTHDSGVDGVHETVAVHVSIDGRGSVRGDGCATCCVVSLVDCWLAVVSGGDIRFDLTDSLDIDCLGWGATAMMTTVR